MSNKSEHITTVAQFISNRMAELGKTSEDVATEVAGASHKVISMIAQGVLKLPISLVGSLSSALDIDAMHLLRLTLREYSPELLALIEVALQRPLLSAREASLINGFRAVTGDRDASSVVVEQDGLLEVIVLDSSTL